MIVVGVAGMIGMIGVTVIVMISKHNDVYIYIHTHTYISRDAFAVTASSSNIYGGSCLLYELSHSHRLRPLARNCLDVSTIFYCNL